MNTQKSEMEHISGPDRITRSQPQAKIENERSLGNQESQPKLSFNTGILGCGVDDAFFGLKRPKKNL